MYFAYYASEEKYTRVTEYKKFTQYKSKDTLISVEVPSLNGKHYPMPFKIEYMRAQKYLDLLPDGFSQSAEPAVTDMQWTSMTAYNRQEITNQLMKPGS